jgi:phenylacetate-CoA ligase
MLPPFDPWRTCIAMMEVSRGSAATPIELGRMQSQRLTALLRAARRSRLYSEIIGGQELSTLSVTDLPVMRKHELMDQFSAWVTEPAVSLDALRAFMAKPENIGSAFLGRFMPWESSGSHGEPGIFVQDSAALAVYDALEYHRRRVPRPIDQVLDPWGLAERKVFIGAIDGHFASTCSIERLRRLNPVLASTLHSLSFMVPIAELTDQLHAIQPAFIATYPSVAVMLAEERLAGRLDVAPREVWTGGETLTDGMRMFIAQAFGCTVVNSYGASEFMSLASECPHGSLHLNSDWVILEPVDDAGRPMPPGEAGATTLLTNLANHTQPIVRYDLGDRVALHDTPCACGSHLPVITVQGRSGDVMHLGKGANGQARISGLALSTVLETVSGLTDFQLIQTTASRLELRTGLPVTRASDVLQQAQAVLQAFLLSQGAQGVEIECHGDRPSQRTRNGKAERIIALPHRV